MKKRKFFVGIDPSVSQDAQIGDWWDNNKICVQVTWTGLTATLAPDITIQLQQGNNEKDFDDIVPFVYNITTASGSITFEHNDFISTYLNLNVVVTDCTGGTMEIHTIAS